MSNYDIIGDIHGFADDLIQLLEKLGYQLNQEGYYSHPKRKVIFLGDFIDRGHQQKAVLNIVMKMVDNHAALAIMGNHEFNALSYHAKHPVTNKPLRSHNDNHTHQHQAFLDAYQDNKPELKQVLDWFKRLPLFLELDEIRVIHACWHQDTMNSIKSVLTAKHCLDNDFLVHANDKKHPFYDAIETLLKGMEVCLPDGQRFKDSYGHSRNRIRIKWWEETAKTYQETAIVPRSERAAIPNTALTAEQQPIGYKSSEKPIFFGHYWFNGQPCIQKSNVACLDYSVAKNGKLVAYRWNHGDQVLSNQQFVF